jgi:putative endonuclease
MAEKNDTGKEGEVVARKYLEENGYRIIETNWRFHRFEIDVIATNGTELVIVEVKTRSSNYLINPESAIDGRKISRLVTASDAYARKNNIEMPVRFDVICLIKNGGAYSVEQHFEDAFYAPLKR